MPESAYERFSMRLLPYVAIQKSVLRTIVVRELIVISG